MGAHGPEIFDEDVAMDVKHAFNQAFAETGDVTLATESVLEEFAEYLDDEDDEIKVVLALAALHLDHGRVEPRIRRRALEIIERREDEGRWFESTWPERARLLDVLREQILDDQSRPHRRSAESERRAAMAEPGLPPGYWGPGVGLNTLGHDVLEAFGTAFHRGLDGNRILEEVEAKFADELTEPTNADEVYLPLAWTMLNPFWKLHLPSRLRERALAAIDRGDATRDWQGVSPTHLTKRREDLGNLRDRLLADATDPPADG